jgi:hypothetical protein
VAGPAALLWVLVATMRGGQAAVFAEPRRRPAPTRPGPTTRFASSHDAGTAARPRVRATAVHIAAIAVALCAVIVAGSGPKVRAPMSRSWP